MCDKSFDDIVQKIKDIEFKENFDCIVAIASGGIIPAAMLNQSLELPFFLLKINLRDKYHTAKFSTPILLEPINFDYKSKNILLVEDRIKTGATINFAINLLKEANLIKTFAVNGNADYCLYNQNCFKFPWIV